MICPIDWCQYAWHESGYNHLSGEFSTRQTFWSELNFYVTENDFVIVASMSCFPHKNVDMFRIWYEMSEWMNDAKLFFSWWFIVWVGMLMLLSVLKVDFYWATIRIRLRGRNYVRIHSRVVIDCWKSNENSITLLKITSYEIMNLQWNKNENGELEETE